MTEGVTLFNEKYQVQREMGKLCRMCIAGRGGEELKHAG